MQQTLTWHIDGMWVSHIAATILLLHTYEYDNVEYT